jgi:Integral membrane protein DUF92
MICYHATKCEQDALVPLCDTYTSTFTPRSSLLQSAEVFWYRNLPLPTCSCCFHSSTIIGVKRFAHIKKIHSCCLHADSAASLFTFVSPPHMLLHWTTVYTISMTRHSSSGRLTLIALLIASLFCQWANSFQTRLLTSTHRHCSLAQRQPPFSLIAECNAVTRKSNTACALSIGKFAEDLGSSLLRYDGHVPLPQALGINVVLFTALSKKLLESLTPAGFVHAMALGTGLWATLGWRGWTLCVLYLVLGNVVTKVKFAEKAKRGLAEGRGGRRGPENVW